MMTDLDAAKLRAAYGCEGVERTTTTITTTATTVGPIVPVPKLLANGNTCVRLSQSFEMKCAN